MTNKNVMAQSPDFLCAPNLNSKKGALEVAALRKLLATAKSSNGKSSRSVDAGLASADLGLGVYNLAQQKIKTVFQQKKTVFLFFRKRKNFTKSVSKIPI